MLGRSHFIIDKNFNNLFAKREREKLVRMQKVREEDHFKSFQALRRRRIIILRADGFSHPRPNYGNVICDSFCWWIFVCVPFVCANKNSGNVLPQIVNYNKVLPSFCLCHKPKNVPFFVITLSSFVFNSHNIETFLLSLSIQTELIVSFFSAPISIHFIRLSNLFCGLIFCNKKYVKLSGSGDWNQYSLFPGRKKLKCYKKI